MEIPTLDVLLADYSAWSTRFPDSVPLTPSPTTPDEFVRIAAEIHGRPRRRYRRRWNIERLFAWLGDFRRLVVRYERHALNYLSFIHLGFIHLGFIHLGFIHLGFIVILLRRHTSSGSDQSS